MVTIAAVVAAGALGAAWRRWYGSSAGSGHGMRFVKHLVGFVLFFFVAWFATDIWWHGAIAALVFSVGMSFGHTFEPWKPLIWRYGAVSAAVAVTLCLLGINWHGFVFGNVDLSAENLNALFYAPFGILTPLGYIVGAQIAKRQPGFCWTCVGECFMGLILLAPIPLLRLV